MIFANLDELVHMNGHGPYVWWSYLVTLAALAALVVLPLLTRHRLLQDIARRSRRDAAAAANPSQEE